MSLVDFRISLNKHTGTVPEEIFKIRTLQFLTLFGNSFTGQLPNSQWSFTNLLFFEIFNNKLSGTIPVEATKMQKLITFKINNNLFRGTLPDFSNCFQLSDFYVHDNDLSGKLTNFGRLFSLVNFAVSRNNFHGSLNDVFRIPLPKLQVADFNDNQFTGKLPAALFNSAVLGLFTASENCMDGEIPPDICLSRNLTYLGISGMTVSPQ